jgi:hypothetical protein
VNLSLIGQSVHTVALDYAVTLRLDGGADIRVEAAFSIRRPDGQLAHVDPEHLGPGLEHIAAVLHQTVSASVAQDGGTLVLDFENGAQIRVAPDLSYEAWSLAGPHGEKIIAMPGGELAIWDPIT